MNAQYEQAWMHAMRSVRDAGPLVVPANKANTVAPYLYGSTGFPPGFHSVGCGADPRTPGRVAIGFYSWPAMGFVNLTRAASGDIEAIREAGPTGFIGRANITGLRTPVRLVAETLRDSDARRMQDVVVRPDGELWFTQNTSSDALYRIKPDSTARTGWRILEPIQLKGDVGDWIESIAVLHDMILVWRADRNNGPGRLVAYDFAGNEVGHKLPHPKGAGFYMGDPLDGEPTFITSPEYYQGGGEPGIYRGDRLIVEGVSGTDVCWPHEDGSGFVVVYGEGNGHWGSPTLWVHVPAALIKREA